MADVIIDGKVLAVFAPAVADIAAPTTTEISAGVVLHDWLTMDGLNIDFSMADVDTTALSSTFNSLLPGRLELTTELTLKDQGRDAAPWTTFADKAEGYLIVRRNVPAAQAVAASDAVEVYPVQSGTRQPMAPAANEVSKFGVTLHHTEAPDTSAVVAA